MPPTAARVPIVADRHTALAFAFTMSGIDLTGWGMRAQVRLYPDAPDSALITLAKVTTAGAQGLRLQSVTGSGADAVSKVEVVVAKTVMETMPRPAEAGTDVELFWDMMMTPLAGIEQRRFFGPFTVLAGVTR